MTPSPAEPIFFGRRERSCFGWLHRAAGASSIGVVVCNPFGYEAVCSHRSLRHLAETIARAGIPALRFDYDGTGDSAGDDRDPDRLAAWVESTRAAVRTLRTLAGVERVWLVGVRLGVLIAALAASDGNPEGIAGLVAIAPVVSGKAYLRELGLLQMALGLGDPPPGAATIEEGAQEALGFVITRDTKQAISRTDLTKLEPFRGAAGRPFDVLVLDRDDLPTADKWVARLTEQGISSASRRMSGYVEMMLDPHKVVSPRSIIAAATEWLSARREENAAPGSGSGEAPRTEAVFGDVIERPVFVDETRRTFGILSAPTGKASGRAVLLLNAGAIHRIGANRLYVRLARRWAALGHHVLRMDLAGIGDSPERPGEPENVVYHRNALEDVGAAVTFLRRAYGMKDIRTAGLCAGAYHAFKTASVDPNVRGFVAINPLAYGARPEGDVMFPVAKVSAEAKRYQKSAFELQKWKKLARGQVNVRVLTEIITRHAVARLKTRARDLSRRAGMPWKHDFIAELDRLTERNVEQRFIFANDDPGQSLLEEQGSAALRKLQKRGALTIEVIDGPDHTFTPLWSHEPLMNLLTAAISGSSAQRS
ncbi:MAG TPA: alpha/beta hydrolase [Labilithrix sp.]|jgi:alpha-beta hydrolase superfamily lysophospholipase|nr:alpha/beta hydrolase [Labilithrix sp.]